MINITEKRRASLISLAYFAVFITIYCLFISYAFWLVFPFVIAFMIAMALQSPINRISSKTHIGKKPLSIIFVLLILIILLGLVALLGYKLVDEFTDFGSFIMSKLDNAPALIHTAENKILSLCSRLPDSLETTAVESIKNLAEKALELTDANETIIQQATETAEVTAAETSSDSVSGMFDFSILATPLGGLWSTAKQIPSILTAVLISIIACFFITSDYENFTGIIKHMLTPEHEEKLVKTKHIIVNVLGKYAKSYMLILFITFCELVVGLNVLKICGAYAGGYIFVIALCTSMLDILPVFGTGTVMIPWAVISLFTHKIGLGIGLIVIYVLIFVIRQVLEPKLVSANVGMHPVITLAAMYLGLQIFGFIGLIIVPITLVVIKTLNEEGIVHLWSNRPAEACETEPEPEAKTAGKKK